MPAAPPVSLDGIDSRISYLEPLVESQQQAVGQLRGVTVEQEKKINIQDDYVSKVGRPRCPATWTWAITTSPVLNQKPLRDDGQAANKKYVDDSRDDTPPPSMLMQTKAPTEKYDGEFTFVTEATDRQAPARASHLHE